jgi:hypothetical protein
MYCIHGLLGGNLGPLWWRGVWMSIRGLKGLGWEVQWLLELLESIKRIDNELRYPAYPSRHRIVLSGWVLESLSLLQAYSASSGGRWRNSDSSRSS